MCKVGLLYALHFTLYAIRSRLWPYNLPKGPCPDRCGHFGNPSSRALFLSKPPLPTSLVWEKYWPHAAKNASVRRAAVGDENLLVRALSHRAEHHRNADKSAQKTTARRCHSHFDVQFRTGLKIAVFYS